ncbi:MAG TPA: hypothetical protein VGJ22_07095 [Anaerolineales bacterium]|jgi:hypothetical protein
MNLRTASAVLLLAVSLLGCNIPTLPSQVITSEMQTAAAQTVQAVLTPVSSPAALATSTAAGTEGAPPLYTVPDATNCRAGPGTGFAKITTIAAGTSVPIVASYSGGTYFVVNPPDVSEDCWVAAALGSVSGNVNAVPEVTPAATSASGAPARPGSLFYNYSCSGGSVTTNLTWGDAADNENGYRVYRFGTVVADLPADSGAFVDTVTVTPGTQLQYAVEAYNDAGASPQRTAVFSCQ